MGESGGQAGSAEGIRWIEGTCCVYGWDHGGIREMGGATIRKIRRESGVYRGVVGVLEGLVGSRRLTESIRELGAPSLIPLGPGAIFRTPPSPR